MERDNYSKIIKECSNYSEIVMLEKDFNEIQEKCSNDILELLESKKVFKLGDGIIGLLFIDVKKLDVLHDFKEMFKEKPHIYEYLGESYDTFEIHDYLVDDANDETAKKINDGFMRMP